MIKLKTLHKIKSKWFSLICITCFSFLMIACQVDKESVAEWQHTAVGSLDAAISSDGRFALVSSVNFGAAYWDIEKNQLLFQWTHNDDPNSSITSVNISPDGSRAITADKETFSIWNTNSGKAYGYWKAPASIRAVALSNKGRYVLLGLGDGRAIHIDMNTGRRLEFTGHRKEAVASVDLSPNGLWAFTGGNDYRAVLWNSRTGQVHQLFEHKTRVAKLKLDYSGKRAFTSGTLGNAYIWDIQSGEQLSKLALKKREYVIVSANFSNSGKQLVTGAPGRDISLWNTESGERIKKWKVRTRKQGKPSGAIVYAVAFSEDDQYVLSESSAGYGEKWSLKEVKDL
jgi:WD40 repeat protein